MEKKKTIPRKEALKTLGLKGSPSKEDIHRAFKNEARKRHPDVVPKGTKTEQQIHDEWLHLLEAYQSLIKPAQIDEFAFREYKNEYDQLAKLSGYSNDVHKLQDARTQLLKIYPEDAAKKIEAAYDKHIQDITDMEILHRSVFRKALRSVVQEAFKTQEQRMDDKIKEINDKLAREKLSNKNEEELAMLIMIMPKKKLPFTHKSKGKKIIKYLAVTAGIIAAILTGKYIWDHRSGSYVPKELPFKGD